MLFAIKACVSYVILAYIAFNLFDLITFSVTLLFVCSSTEWTERDLLIGVAWSLYLIVMTM